MRYYVITVALIAALLISFGCGRTRQIESAVPQSGPLVGTWQYVGDDLSDIERGVVRRLVIGDGPWYIPKTLTFKPDGTSDNIGYHACHFWILDNSHVKLSVGNGNTIVPYQIERDTLTLTLSRTYDNRSPVLTFTRINP